jgi:Ca2+-binding EF-hand superfamily protein
VEQVLQDVRQANQGGSACSFKTFVDFMTRRRINVAFVDKGFVDPLIAQCCQHFARAKDIFGLDWEQLFDLFDGERSGRLSQEEFLICAQGLEADIAVEDLKELFNYVDAQQANYVTKLQFVDALTYVTNKLGGQSALDSRLNKGLAQAKRGPTSRQAVLDVLKNVAKSVVEKQLEMRQVIQIVDVHRRGEISRAELSQVLRGLCDSITLEQSRRLHLFFDEAGTGSISVPELVGLLQDLINQQVGAGAFAFRQVQPIINKIINELAIDADNFFDEVADQNAAEMKEEAGDNGKRTTASSRDQVCGLSKRLFFRQLAQYGVSLSEQDKAALCQVFGLDEAQDKLDYLKLD